ncbi:MAG: hypothetical protein KBC91_06250, partial [Candidatus Omnitrophica bacterium]|nr:hypothetical protein [Candidatus Omnitrophota bacterium]
MKFSLRNLLVFGVSALFFGTCGVPSALAVTNLASNPGFEAAIGGASNWDDTNAALRVNAAGMPAGFSAIPAGVFALRLNVNTFTFQTNTDISAGDTVTFSARAESSAAGAGTGGRLKLEFKNAADVTISTALSALINTTNAPNGVGFQTFQAVGVAPAGTVTTVFVFETSAIGAGEAIVFDSALVTAATGTTLAAGGTPVSTANVLGNPGIEESIG